MKITTAYIKQEIPNWMTKAEFDELCEVWDGNMEDCDDPECKKIDFPVYCKVGKNWKRVWKRKIDDHIIRIFELSPGPIFEGIYKLEVVTDLSDTKVLQTCFHNE